MRRDLETTRSRKSSRTISNHVWARPEGRMDPATQLRSNRIRNIRDAPGVYRLFAAHHDSTRNAHQAEPVSDIRWGNGRNYPSNLATNHTGRPPYARSPPIREAWPAYEGCCQEQTSHDHFVRD